MPSLKAPGANQFEASAYLGQHTVAMQPQTPQKADFWHSPRDSIKLEKVSYVLDWRCYRVFVVLIWFDCLSSLGEIREASAF